MSIMKLLKRILLLRQMKKRGIVYGNNLVINGKILMSNPLNLQIGNYVKINSGFINPVGSEVCSSFSTYGEGKIIIGNNTGISNTVFYSRKGIFIEDDVMIGGGCRIYDTDFHQTAYEERMLNIEETVPSNEIYIRKGAFIGAHSIILKGVEIGEKSVVGAGSVVTKTIPAGEVWAGNPAVFIKKI